ncbi:MAG: (4Fe-4S)-binding protein [Acidithiobacillales bacterium SM23_46]|nr:MAG: (4Fe-4S)-binding protein [Acidithiobacillales bacterium SM23_46]
MKELVVISGKGGTGKTSLVASFAVLAERKVLADCDVDAADLHLVLAPRVEHRELFRSGKVARIRSGHCTACGKCEEVCRFDAVFFDGPGNGRVERTFRIDPIACEGCGVCVYFCQDEAIEFKETVNGEWFISETRHGPMVHARLGIAAENSGKLVTLVRTQAKQVAEQHGLDLIILDGAPGIGCPVIASITGSDLVLIITEPTVSGLHDLERVARLAEHFQIPRAVCINKFDLNEQMTERIEQWCGSCNVPVIGRIPYDTVFTDAMVHEAAVVEYSGGVTAQTVKEIWRGVTYALG